MSIHLVESFSTDEMTKFLDLFTENKQIKINGKHQVNRSNSIRLFCRKGIECVRCHRIANSADLMIDSYSNTYQLKFTHVDVTSNHKVAFTADHIIPKSLGGQNKLDNLQTMCSRCNSTKSDKLVFDYSIPNLLLYVAHVKVLMRIYFPFYNKKRKVRRMKTNQVLRFQREVMEQTKTITSIEYNQELYEMAFAIGFKEFKEGALISSLNKSKIIL